MQFSDRIVIIGGTACGPKAAARTRRCNHNAKITLIEQEENISTAVCGLPYYISDVIRGRNNLLARSPAYFSKVFDIKVLTHTRAVSIDRESHIIKLINLKNNKSMEEAYDKLVIATGSLPIVPNIDGASLGGIITLKKIQDAETIKNILSNHKINKVVIIGAGLIGLEMAEVFLSLGIEVVIIEALDWILPKLLDFEVATYVERYLKSQGIEFQFGQRVRSFEGNQQGWVQKVLTDDLEIETQLVILAIGNKPNTELASNAGIILGPIGGITVNKYLQTSDPDIYAGGDCVETVHHITKQKVLVPLGSTANKHGRIIGSNLGGNYETCADVLATSIVKVIDYNIGCVGLNESQARDNGYEIFTSLVPSYDHAAYYPGGQQILIKLIANEVNGQLLGGQIVGPGDVAKRIDILVTALNFGATVNDLANLDLAYAPPYNSALDPLHHAANIIRNKMSGYAKTLSPMEVKRKLNDKDDYVLLDVRAPMEWQNNRLTSNQVLLIPIHEIRSRLHDIPASKEIIAYCQTSVRAYQAQCILNGAGFSNVKFMDGSIASWPYDLESGYSINS